MRTRTAALLLLLALARPSSAQDWQSFEVDLKQDAINDAIERQQRAAEHARRIAPPEPEATSLGEAWSRLERAIAQVRGARLELTPGRIQLDANISIFALIGFTNMQLSIVFEPRVTAPNVVELVAVGGRNKFGNQEWETLDRSGLEMYVSKLAEEMNANPGEMQGAVRFVRGQGGAHHRLSIDLAGVNALEGVELLDLRPGAGQITLAGRTTRDRLEVEVGAGEVNDGLREMRHDPTMAGLDSLLGPNSYLDVGRDRPGRITLHGRADLPWLPTTDYQAVFRVERAGPHEVRLVLEDTHIGGDNLDGFLRTRVGASVKRWLMNKIYQRLDQQERVVAAAYERGEGGVRLSHDPATPHIRTISLRPGFAGPATVRPGFEIEDVRVEPGSIRLVTRLTRTPGGAVTAGAPTTPPARGAVGALGGAGLD
jgi:hypothetical protein